MNKTDNFPGPSDYNHDKKIVLKAYPSYSMGKKFINKTETELPGPGDYNYETKGKNHYIK